MRLRVITIQAIRFFFTSGLGWIVDFFVYIFLTLNYKIDVGIANFISAIPAVTFVFIVSTRKIFQRRQSKIPLYCKYLIYILYQFILLLLVSSLNKIVFVSLISGVLAFSDYAAVIAKIIITPVTMIANFIALKLLSEKV